MCFGLSINNEVGPDGDKLTCNEPSFTDAHIEAICTMTFNSCYYRTEVGVTKSRDLCKAREEKCIEDKHATTLISGALSLFTVIYFI